MEFNKDNTIHFDVNEWTCTDVDTCQFCRKINDKTFEYIQLKVDQLCRFITIFRLNNKHLLEMLNDKTKVSDWYEDEICVDDYDADQLGEEVAPFGGEEFLNGSKGAERNQLICECIFENDIMNGEYE